MYKIECRYIYGIIKNMLQANKKHQPAKTIVTFCARRPDMYHAYTI